jgi:general stress protein YciG
VKSHNDITITVTVAGRKGGLSCLHKNGPEFYRQIGKKGQAVMRQRHPNMAKQWGKLGGRPRKNSLNDMGE